MDKRGTTTRKDRKTAAAKDLTPRDAQGVKGGIIAVLIGLRSRR
ncbi:MAG: hypothetical protein ACREM3_05230 [Candidatus Rokuibacteriota bacterium]